MANAEAEVPAIQMVGFRTTREEIQGIYNEVYQLKRLPSPPPYGPEQMEALDWEICTSLGEQMQQRQGSTRPEKEPERGATGILQPSCQSKSPQRNWVRGKDPHNHALAEAREVHQRALEAAHLLEQNIERLSQAATRAKSARCWHSYSHSHSRRWPQIRHPQSPSHTRPRKHVTFQNEEDEISSGEDPSRQLLGQATGEEELEEYDLGPLPTLKPELESFLEALAPTRGAGDRHGSPLEPSIENYEVWLEWQTCQVDMPDWWGELVIITNAGDPERLAHKSCASFEVPQVMCEALRDYTAPLPQNVSRGRCSCWSPIPIYLVRITT